MIKLLHNLYLPIHKLVFLPLFRQNAALYVEHKSQCITNIQHVPLKSGTPRSSTSLLCLKAPKFGFKDTSKQR